MNKNLRVQLQNMSISDLRFVCQELKLSSTGNKTQIIKRLVQPLNRKYGFNINDQNDSDNVHPVFFIDIGDTQKIRELIDNGLNINSEQLRDKNGKTLLMVAVLLERTDIVELLLERGAKVNIQDNNGLTALMYSENTEIAKMLLSYGADIHIRDAERQTALMQLENTEIAQMLIDNGAIIDAQDQEDQTALFINVRENNIDMVKLLLDNGADVSIRDDNNDTMLMYAESVEIAKMLVDNGSDINEANSTGQTAIVFSSIAGDVEMVKFLLDNGASLFNCKKNISLMKKIEKDRKNTIKKIIKIYSDENYKDDDDKINENIKEKQQLVESYEKVIEILKGHILYNLLNEFTQLITVDNLKSTLICIKYIIKKFDSVDTFKKDFKFEIKRKKEQLNVEDKSNYWNREIASLVGEILKLF